MANLFKRYRFIAAEEIARDNIRTEKFADDLHELIAVFSQIVKLIQSENSLSIKRNLHEQLVERFEKKTGIIELIQQLGYYRQHSGVIAFDGIKFSNDSARLPLVQQEIQNFLTDLKKIRAQPNIWNTIHPHQPRPSPQITLTSENPGSNEVQRQSDKTIDIVQTLKTEITLQDGYKPSMTFLRRRVSKLALKKSNHDYLEMDDELIDSIIDNFIHDLKQSTNHRNLSDEVFLECLLRTNFNLQLAKTMITENCPNLTTTNDTNNPEQVTSLDALRVILGEISQQIHGQRQQEQITIQLLHEGDEWKNTYHILQAIVAIKQRSTDSIEDRIYRLMYSELNSIVGQQPEYKIRAASMAMARSDVEVLQKLNVADFKDIMGFTDNYDFGMNLQTRIYQSLNVECQTCYNSSPRSQMESFVLCEHQCCTECMRMYYKDAISSMTDEISLSKLTCYEGHELSDQQDDRMMFFNLLDNLLKRLFRDQRGLLDRYYQNLFFATKDQGMMKCINPKCPDVFDTGNHRRQQNVRCPSCRYDQCVGCRRKWLPQHNEMNCGEYVEWLNENDPDDPQVQLNKYLETAGVVCPNNECNETFEYVAGGCEHFTCPKCKTEFCRICSNRFYNPKNNTRCPRAGCTLVNTLHSHCALNCYREIRDAGIGALINILEENDVDWRKELEAKPEAANINCPVNGCPRPVSAERMNRFCETCFTEFVCLLIWRRQIEPWKLYEDHQLRVRLAKINQVTDENTPHETLIEMAQEHLTQFLGQPRRFRRNNGR